MKIWGFIIAGCIVLSVLRTLIIGMVIVFVAVLLWGAFFRPRETFGMLAVILAASLLEHHMLACVLILGFALVIARVRRIND